MIERWIPKLKKDQCLPGLTLRMWTDKEGEYILYTDHIAAIAEKDKEIERLKAELKVAYAINKQNITVYDADTLLKEDGDGETDNYES